MRKWGFSAIFSRLVHAIVMIMHILKVLNGLHDLRIVSLMLCNFLSTAELLGPVFAQVVSNS